MKTPDKFHIGDMVIHRTDGVCKVVGMVEMDGDEAGKPLQYLHVAPESDTDACIYVPLDRADEILRPTMSRESATVLLTQIGGVDVISIPDEKNREAQYKQILRSGDCLSVTGLIKTLNERRETRKALKKGLPSVDERYLKMAETMICSELSVPLNLSMQQTEERIRQAVGE